MERQPHLRVPREEFFDQPPRQGEQGYNERWTPAELEEYKRQQRGLERMVYAQEKINLEQEIRLCTLRAGSLIVAQRECADLVKEYMRRVPRSPLFGVSAMFFFVFFSIFN
jgi:hypothetical protein